MLIQTFTSSFDSRSMSRTTIEPLVIDHERQRRRDERFERSPRDAVTALALLVWIGRRPERDRLALSEPWQLAREQLGEVDLHVDLAVEARAGVAAAARVVVACVAVRACPLAAVVWVEAPPERHALDARERALHRDLAVQNAAPHGQAV